MFVEGKKEKDRSPALRALDLRLAAARIVRSLLISVLVLITVPPGAVRTSAA